MDNHEFWYVVQTNPRKEQLVNEQLLAKSVETYFPTVEVVPANPRAANVRPFFPGYIFIQISPEDIGSVEYMTGVKQVEKQFGQPVKLHDSIVRELQRLVSEINVHGPLDIHHFNNKRLIHVNEGPLSGHEWLFDMRYTGSERIQALLSISVS